MANKPAVFVVGTKCAPELEAKFNKWYDEVHIPLLRKSRLLLSVTRYKLAPGTEGDYPKYMASYEFKDLAALKAWEAGEEMRAAREEKKVSWATESFESKWRVAFEPIKTWSK